MREKRRDSPRSRCPLLKASSSTCWRRPSPPGRSWSSDYFAWALEHSRPGSLIVADNVVRDGQLADLSDDEPAIAAQRRFHERLAAEPRVEATTIQTVGGKGYDGFSLIRVLD